VNTTAQSRHAGAAEALIALLPSASPLGIALARVADVGHDEQTGAIVASFVGDASADVALIFPDAAALAAAESDIVSVLDVLRPAFEGATAAIGAGVLGELRADDASALFDDPSSTVFAITRDGGAVGWFAIRTREAVGRHGAARAPRAVTAEMLGRINSVEMALTVEIGRTRMSVRDVLSLEPGSVIELDRAAGAPADILLNGRLIAHGEIVVVDQDYAVRITEILDVATAVA